jgi:hypothetical protein
MTVFGCSIDNGGDGGGSLDPFLGGSWITRDKEYDLTFFDASVVHGHTVQDRHLNPGCGEAAYNRKGTYIYDGNVAKITITFEMYSGETISLKKEAVYISDSRLEYDSKVYVRDKIK